MYPLGLDYVALIQIDAIPYWHNGFQQCRTISMVLHIARDIGSQDKFGANRILDFYMDAKQPGELVGHQVDPCKMTTCDVDCLGILNEPSI